jgi:hypothetical protein
MAIGSGPTEINVAEKFLRARQAGHVAPKKITENRPLAVSNPHQAAALPASDTSSPNYKGRGSLLNIVV